MPLKPQLTTRWQRLRQGAEQLAASAEGQPVVEPFGGVAAPVQPQVPTDDFGLERSVLAAWRDFFARFREDEREFELPHYLEAGQLVEERLGYLSPGSQPDIITCRMMLDLQRQFEAARFRDFNDRLGELMVSSQQLKAQLDVSELSKCYKEDELRVCERQIREALAAVGITVPERDDGLPQRVSDLLRALLAARPAPAPAKPALATPPPFQPLVPAVPSTPAPAAAAASAGETLDIHARDSLDWTKLHSAAFYGRTELVELLIAQGADVNARAKDGVTPLHLAAKRAQTKAAKYLFSKGANLAAKDNDGNSPLHLAADMFSGEIISALVAMGSYVNVKNNDGWTPLHLAANRGKQEIVELLLTLGADANLPAGNGWTPLKVAMNSGHLQIAEFLRQRGARQ
jgi:hypothetical protein